MESLIPLFDPIRGVSLLALFVKMFLAVVFGGLIGLFGLPITAAIIMDLNSSGVFHIFNSVDGELEKENETTEVQSE